MSGLLTGKRVLVAGILTEQSIAFSAAKLAQEEGAELIITWFGRESLVDRIVKRLPKPVGQLIELDVTNQEHLDGLADKVREQVDGLDGVVHSIANAPQSCLGGGFLDAPWEDVSRALHVSAYSLKSLTMACAPLMPRGGSVVGLDFDAAQAWPVYDWMGVSKATLESTARYLAKYLGPKRIRVNLVAAGPLRSMAAKSIPGFEQFEETWVQRAPMGWDLYNHDQVGRTICALLSDWLPATTGEIVHVDGGFHAVGA